MARLLRRRTYCNPLHPHAQELEAKAKAAEAKSHAAAAAGGGRGGGGEVPWVQPGIVVKVMSKQLEKHGYYKKKVGGHG
jgi:hypothetical protein